MRAAARLAFGGAAVLLQCWAAATSASCVDKYSQSNKPWEDFVSCEAEREFCQSDAQLRANCAKTCGTCSTAEPAQSKYTVKACVAPSLQDTCELRELDLRETAQPVDPQRCDKAVDMRGSVSWADMTLPTGSVLLIEVTTDHPAFSSATGFFVRPTRRTRDWGRPTVSATSARFYLAGTGQFSVEFVPPEFWRSTAALSFDALMLFVNPELEIPAAGAGATVISPDTNQVAVDLGPNKAYIFTAANVYDWGRDQVFRVHSNTQVYFEPGAYVRARIVQTQEKVDGVLIAGYGTLDAHYELEPDLVGVSDDATTQTISIFGKNIRVHGVTILNTIPKCGSFGYCLNINANWSPIGQSQADPFGADELQDQTMPAPDYKPRKAHCQLRNMDDTPNTNFENCPTSHADGQTVSFVKCMTWQMGQDGLNAGKYGTVDNSFVRVIDDAIKPWDSYGVYKSITIWQLSLGWPINLGWWNWNQPDVDTLVEDIYVIHNHNWYTSDNWPATKSGQCTIGAIYGSGAVKKRYHLKNIFVETAASCAVGLEISKSAYNRHPTQDGCVGSIMDMKINGLFFDEDFKTGPDYGNYISGEADPYSACTGDLSGQVTGLAISSNVAGRALQRSDFTLPEPQTVPGLTFSKAVDPHPVILYNHFPNKNAKVGAGAISAIDSVGVVVRDAQQCVERCHSDWSCDCAVFRSSNGKCWKKRGCQTPAEFESSDKFDVYVRPWPGANKKCECNYRRGRRSEDAVRGRRAIATNAAVVAPA